VRRDDHTGRREQQGFAWMISGSAVVNPFVRFGPMHLGILAVTVGLPVALAAVTHSRRNNRVAKIICGSFFSFLIAARILWLVLLKELTLETMLPMHLCDWAAIAIMITLVYPNQRTFELSYFWILGGTLQALLTPDLANGFPDPQFIIFFALHGGVLAALLYLVLGRRMRPVPMSIMRALAWSLLYLVLAMTLNARLGTNFGYLSGKPTQPSLLDLMSPWPYYIPELALIAFISSLIYYAPFFLLDRLARVPQ
jgi:hypothetical integral membrane protein (TIGR02206 family)